MQVLKTKINKHWRSIYERIWPSFTDKSHTNECLTSNLIDNHQILQNLISQQVMIYDDKDHIISTLARNRIQDLNHEDQIRDYIQEFFLIIELKR